MSKKNILKVGLIFLGAGLLASFDVQAKKGHHHHHGAHEHGAAKLSIAFDGLEGQIEFESPAADIMGFEYRPKNLLDKKKSEEALAKLKSSKEFLIFSSDLQCEQTDAKSEVKYQGSHGEVHALWKVKCAKSPVKSSLNIKIGEIFPSLEKLEIEALIGDLQKKFNLKKANGTIEW